MSFTITSALRWWRCECPDELAWSVDDELLTYRELMDWSGRVGAFLQSRGVKPGDRVTMMARNTIEYAVLAIALVRIGAIGTPINFRSTARELAESCEDFEPVVVFADAERYATAQEGLGENSQHQLLKMEDVRSFREGEPVDLNHEPHPDDPVFIIGTSGSTGRPKGVIYTHRMILTYASEFAIAEPRCAHGSSVLSPGPFSSSSGYLLLMQFTSLGVTMYIESQFVPERALKLLTEHSINTFQAAPIFFERIAALPEFKTADLSKLHFAQVGGATVPRSLLDAWREKGVILRQAYGSTESGGAWAARNDTALTEPEKCGRGGVFTEFAILAEDGSLAPPGQPGEVLVRSACVTTGYWNDPKATEESFVHGGFRTGDLGVLDEAGNLTFLDRLKDIIISGGLNISAAEVERVIRDMDGVEEVAVIKANDDKFGETPLAIIYGDNSRLSPEAVVAHCDKHLSNYKVPRYVVIEPEPLPRLPSGKISKQALREKYKDADKQLEKVR